MELDDNIARQIVARAMRILPYSVNVMDRHGHIIASGDPSRLHQRHEGAILALTENRVVEIDDATALSLKGVRPGINLPIAFQEELIGVIGISGAPEQVRAFAALVQMTAELILEQAALSEQLLWDRRHKEELVLQLVRGDGKPAQLAQSARLLGIDLSQPRVAAVIRLEQADPARLRELVHLLENPERDNLVAIHGLDEIAVLKPIRLGEQGWQTEGERERVKELLGRIAGFRVRIGIGDHFPGVEGLALSWRTARETLLRGSRQAPRRQVYFFEDYKLPVLLGTLADSWQGSRLTIPLQRLADEDSKGTLRKSLEHYFGENCDLHRAAAALFIHPNTLRYRLTRIEQITGLNINVLEEKLLLYLALTLAR